MGIVNLVGWAIFGLIAGAIARFVLPGKQSMNMLMTMLLGVVGSFVGGGLSYVLFRSGSGALQSSGWIMSILGAVILLAIYSAAMAKKAS